MIKDAHGRSFKKLRVSLTHECNYACLYCSDRFSAKESVQIPVKDTLASVKKVLPTHELIQIIENLHAELNLQMVRLTGGEPLLHPRIETIVSEIKRLGIEKIALTTNGHLLFDKVEQLKKAGLSSVNISLDAMVADTFKEMSRYSGLPNVLKSIDAAIACGLEVKLNSVILRGRNSHQIIPLLEYAMEKGIVIRFLELMAMGPLHKTYNELFFSEADIINCISDKYVATAIPKELSATAHYWSIDGKKAFGIIANDSNPFCADCNRLRLDSYGNIYGCLSSLKAIGIQKDTKGLMLRETLSEALRHKQPTHFVGNTRTMQSIGG